MFGGESNTHSAKLFGGESSSSGANTIPNPIGQYLFPDPPVCASCCPDLTYTQRIVGFACCAGLGYLLSLFGTLSLINGFTDANVRIFSCLYVGGNIIALAATGFLLGPKAQCINMWKPTRRYTTAFYLSMLIVVFALAIAKQNIYLILFMLFIEVLAAIWYSISYIPYGRLFVSTLFRRTGLCFPCYACYDAVVDHQKKQASSSSSLFGGGANNA